jgi:hypothetical protein
MSVNNGGDKGTRNLVIIMVSFIVLIGVVFSLINSRSNSTVTTPASVSSTDGYGIVLNPDSKPTIDVYIDYQCPICKNFEILNGGYLNEVIAQKKAKVVYHPMTFIGPESILAANAAACAADEDKFVGMNLALFQDQSATENSGKWQGDSLLKIGKSIGLNSGKFEKCVKDGNYVKWTGNVAAASAKANVNGTPTIFIDGKELNRNTDYGDPIKFKAALAAGGVK